MESVRKILKFRDDLDNEDVDELFQCFEDSVAEGACPEDAIQDELGLEPDYLMQDDEIWGRVMKAFIRREKLADLPSVR